MNYRYGIYQATKASCVLYKEDRDGNQSTFTVLNTHTESEGKQGILVFIDNELAQHDNVFLPDIKSTKDLLEAFNYWAQDAPVVFEMEAQSCLSRCVQGKKKSE